LEYDAELRSILEEGGLFNQRCPVKERKKYGQPGARKTDSNSPNVKFQQGGFRPPFFGDFL